MSSSDIHCHPGDLCISTHPLSLKLLKPVLNRFTNSKVSSTYMAAIALHCHNGFAFSQSNDTLCFLLHICHHTEYVQQWQWLLKLKAYSTNSYSKCKKMCMFKKTLRVAEHITGNPISTRLFSWKLLIINHNQVHHFLWQWRQKT